MTLSVNLIIGDIPQDISVDDKTTAEKIKLIQQLPEEDCNALFHIIDSMLTKSIFKDFFNKNIATL